MLAEQPFPIPQTCSCNEQISTCMLGSLHADACSTQLAPECALTCLDLQFHHIATGRGAHKSCAHICIALAEGANISGVFIMVNDLQVHQEVETSHISLPDETPFLGDMHAGLHWVGSGRAYVFMIRSLSYNHCRSYKLAGRRALTESCCCTLQTLQHSLRSEGEKSCLSSERPGKK